ncbi:MAG: SpoIIE family protein phosphatase [Anaerolineae bacterium]|nr:SpoIIE family protein phosphatase [Anaerolineae bacterium]
MPNTNLLLGDLSLGQATDPGRTGKNNEDYFGAFEVDWQDDLRLRQIQVAVVCDGIGGNNAGEVASKVAVEKVRALMGSEVSMPIPERMTRAVQAANQLVFDTSQNRPELRGMGTTIVLAAIDDRTLYLAHAGDSRAYLIRNGTAYRLTLDHTWAQEAIDHGVLTPEAARVHPNRNVIKRYLGVDETLAVDSNIIDISQGETTVEGAGKWPTVPSLALQPGDSVLLCSDGLTDEISDEELQTLVRKHGPQEAADRLVALANEHGGRDNITVVVMRLPGGAAAPVAAVAAATTAVARDGSSLPLILGAVALLVILAGAALISLPKLGNNATGATTTVGSPTPLQALVLPPSDTPTAVASLPSTNTPIPTDTVEAQAVTAPPTPVPVIVTRQFWDGRRLVTVEEIATSPATDGNLPATSTPIATHTQTPLPTATQVPALATPTPIPLREASETRTVPSLVQPAGAVTVSLVSPNDGDSGSTARTFEWIVRSGALATNQAFELRFWKTGQDALNDGLGLGGTTRSNQQTINLAAADSASLIKPGEYLWGVLLVETSPLYRPLGLISGTRTFRYERSGGGQPEPQATLPPT